MLKEEEVQREELTKKVKERPEIAWNGARRWMAGDLFEMALETAVEGEAEDDKVALVAE